MKHMNKADYTQLLELRDYIKEFRKQLYENASDLATKPSMLYGFSFHFPALYQTWKNSNVEHGDASRINSLLKNLCTVKTILSIHPTHHHEEICKACLLLDEAADHLTFLFLNQMEREDWNSPPPALTALCQREEVSNLEELSSVLSLCISRLPFLILDSACRIQGEFDDAFPQLSDYIWNHHIPVTQEQAQLVLDEELSGEDLLEEMNQFFRGQYQEDFGEEFEEEEVFEVVFEEEEFEEDFDEDEFEEGLYLTSFDFAPLLAKLE